jgi:hypothetical protein
MNTKIYVSVTSRHEDGSERKMDLLTEDFQKAIALLEREGERIARKSLRANDPDREPYDNEASREKEPNE